MSEHFQKNSKVKWSWRGRTISGVVEQVFKKSVTKKIKEKSITRHGSPETPAYLVKSDAGNLALKLETEIRPLSSSNKKTRTKPKMFQT